MGGIKLKTRKPISGLQETRLPEKSTPSTKDALTGLYRVDILDFNFLAQCGGGIGER